VAQLLAEWILVGTVRLRGGFRDGVDEPLAAQLWQRKGFGDGTTLRKDVALGTMWLW
jgi:hypothetical protein